MTYKRYIYQALISALCILTINCSLLPPEITELSPRQKLNQQALSTHSDKKLILVNFASKKTFNVWETSQSYSYSKKNWEHPIHIAKSIKQLEKDYQLTEIDDWPIKSLELHCVLYSVNSQESVNDVLARINADQRVAFAEQLQDFELMGKNVTYRSDTNKSLDIQHPDTTSWIKGLHQFSTGRDIKIGIIDSAIDAEHPDLSGRIYSHKSLLDANTSPSFEHGTAVAGIIGASSENISGSVGLVPDASLYAYEACGSRNNKTFCDSFTLAKALEYALQDNLHILNLSLAGRETPLLRALVDKLLDEGVILIAAENNKASHNFPAQLEGVYAANNKIADSFWFANDEQLSTKAGGGYRFFYGTSMSAAGMTGFSAALYSVYEAKSVIAILDSLANNDCDTPFSGLPFETQQVAKHLCPIKIEETKSHSYSF